MTGPTISPVDLVRDALELNGCQPRSSERQFMARCPAHGDRNPSLSVGSGNDGRALVNCFAGCAVEDVLAELSLCLHDLFPPEFDDNMATVRRTIGSPRDELLPSRNEHGGQESELVPFSEIVSKPVRWHGGIGSRSQRSPRSPASRRSGKGCSTRG